MTEVQSKPRNYILECLGIFPIVFKEYKKYVLLSLVLNCLLGIILMTYNNPSLKRVNDDYNIIVKNEPVQSIFKDASRRENILTMAFLNNLKEQNTLNTKALINYDKNLNDAISYLRSNPGKGFVFSQDKNRLEDNDAKKMLPQSFPIRDTNNLSSTLHHLFSWYGVIALTLVSFVFTMIFLFISVLIIPFMVESMLIAFIFFVPFMINIYALNTLIMYAFYNVPII